MKRVAHINCDDLKAVDILPTKDETLKKWADIPFHQKMLDPDDITGLIGSFRVVCFQKPEVFEVWTKEYIEALVSYLEENFGSKHILDRPRILEVGAGNGKLTYWLRHYLPEWDIIAIDDASWEWDGGEEEWENHGVMIDRDIVEEIDYKEALEKYCQDGPVIIICSWMPYEDDWTPDFRRYDDVSAYIMIGESWGGCCGSDSTWHDHPDFDQKDLELGDQICRTDSWTSDGRPNDYYRCLFHSNTVAFIREE